MGVLLNQTFVGRAAAPGSRRGDQMLQLLAAMTFTGKLVHSMGTRLAGDCYNFAFLKMPTGLCLQTSRKESAV